MPQKYNSKLIQTFSIVVDVNYSVKAFPLSGTETNVLSSGISLGGGYSAMIAARRLGMRIEYAGKIGRGPFSELARESMDSDGIEYKVSSSPLDANDIGVCSVIVEPNAERTFLKHHGIERFGFTGAENILNSIETSNDFVSASGYSFALDADRSKSLALWRCVTRCAHTIFDPSPVHDRIKKSDLFEIIRAAEWVSISEKEASEITGRPTQTEAAIQLAQSGPNVVLRCGDKGAILAMAGSDRASHVPTLSVRAIDSTAAGETHIGVMAFALSRHAAPLDAVRLANIAAALSTTRRGASTAPTHHELEQAIAQLEGMDHLRKHLLP
jgi:sugar/nucleoside kinase (ribokinase family)